MTETPLRFNEDEMFYCWNFWFCNLQICVGSFLLQKPQTLTHLRTNFSKCLSLRFCPLWMWMASTYVLCHITVCSCDTFLNEQNYLTLHYKLNVFMQFWQHWLMNSSWPCKQLNIVQHWTVPYGDQNTADLQYFSFHCSLFYN